MNPIARILIAALLSLVSLSANAQFKQEIKDKIHQYLLVQQKLNGFNGLVQISNAGDTFTDTIGFAVMEYKVPVQTASVFRIASITKQFTAALTAKAIVDGKLRINDSLGQFFPSAPPGWKAINIHQLLTHTSGIPHNEGIKGYWQTKSLLPFTPSQAMEEIFSMTLLFKPGTGTQYSSQAYMLLANILEQVYKDSFQQILSREVFIPLKMHTSGVYSPLRIVPRMTSGYHLAGDSLMAAPYRDYSLMKGSGDLYTSAADLQRWNNSFLAEGFWHPKVKDILFTIQNTAPINGHSDTYGYG
ncbi:serine hydrolase [uncultured Chitinophaga sp.]|uniref:serine hydrolase domain-containing protein n=1 Tax=uncultured Chitinophaga sp. TaxID=339340 RepID=UPI0025FE6043|nr:serine hydrolase domain-containing protein [uncultured Chitinophaga sp.]